MSDATWGAGRAAGVVAVSVVIVNWNSRPALADCLASLAAFPPPEPWEVTVIDNGSTDGSVEWLRQRSPADVPAVRLIANQGNRGLPAANNQGITASRGEALLICNPDVVFHHGAVAALVELLDRRPEAGIVVPRLLYPDGEVQTSAGDLPTLAQALRGRQAQRRRGGVGQAEGFWWDGWPHDTERRIGRGHEAAYVVRRHAVAEVGLQDERFPLDWEGIDWTARFRDAGWEVWLCPAAEVVHLGGASIRQVPYRWVVSSHRGMYRYFAKRRPAYWRPVLAAIIGGRAAVKLGATAAGAAMYERGHPAGAAGVAARAAPAASEPERSGRAPAPPHLLDHPARLVGIAEGTERVVVASSGVGAVDLPAVLEVEQLADTDATVDQRWTSLSRFGRRVRVGR